MSAAQSSIDGRILVAALAALLRFLPASVARDLANRVEPSPIPLRGVVHGCVIPPDLRADFARAVESFTGFFGQPRDQEDGLRALARHFRPEVFGPPCAPHTANLTLTLAD